jgi:phosphatidylinositol alpha-mannosyltransferase
LLAAFARLQANLPEARLVVVGGYRPQSAEKYRNYVEDHHLRDVHFVGRVSDDDLPRYYRTAHVFCAPSTGFESFGIVLLEAMAAGTPVVASDISGYRGILTHGRQGLLVPPEDEAALAHALQSLLTSPERRAAMGAAGRQTARRYDWPLVARQVAAYYDEVLVRARA